MQQWLLFGILSNLAYAISTSLDKYFMNHKHDPVSTNMFKMFFDGLILLIIGFLLFNLHFTYGLLIWSLILGGIYALSGIIYFDSLELEDVEVVVPYLQSSTLLLVFISSIIVFKESTNTFNYLGIFLILFGIYAVLSKKGFKFPKLDKGILLVLILVVITTIYSLLVKKLLFDIEPINLAIMMYLSSSLIILFYILLFRKKKEPIEIKSSKIFASAIFGALGTLLLFYALFFGNASKVYAIGGLESAFVFVIASIFLRERFYWHRLIGTGIIIIGIFLISV